MYNSRLHDILRTNINTVIELANEGKLSLLRNPIKEPEHLRALPDYDDLTESYRRYLGVVYDAVILAIKVNGLSPLKNSATSSDITKRYGENDPWFQDTDEDGWPVDLFGDRLPANADLWPQMNIGTDGIQSRSDYVSARCS